MRAAEGRPRGRRWVAVLPLMALALILQLVRLPYFVFSPGPTRDVIPLIKVEGRTTYPPEGHLLLTSVFFSQATLYQIVAAWLDPARSVVPEREVLAPGESITQNISRARSQMDMSQIDAAIVALTEYAGYPERHRPGVLVEDVLQGTPAQGRLFAGDLILEVDGHAIANPEELGERISEAGVGHPLTLTVQPVEGEAAKTEDVTVVPRMVEGVDHPVIGISAVANFPFPVEIRNGDVGGPSAGLMWTLGLIDLLTPGDLTAGRTIAGTGVISPDGKVEPIGGVEEKVVAAERAGAVVFFVPVENAAAARSVSSEMRIVPVADFRRAVRFLQGGG